MKIEPNDPAADRVDYCDECGEEAGQCECDQHAMLTRDVASVLAKLDELAEIWGDEGVFRRCRDRLRMAVRKWGSQA